MSASQLISFDHLRFLLKFGQYCGLTDFTYNPSTGRVATSNIQFAISRVICVFCVYVNLCSLFILIVVVLVNTFPSLNWSSKDLIAFEKDADLFLQFSMFMNRLPAVILFGAQLIRRHSSVPIINEFLELHEQIRSMTHEDLYYPARFQVFFIFRLCMYTVRFISLLMDFFLDCYTLMFTFGFREALLQICFWGNLFANLILTCFYLKMNVLLDDLLADVEDFNCAAQVSRLMCISERINRLKAMLDGFFYMFYWCSFVILLRDVKHMLGLFFWVSNCRKPGKRAGSVSSGMWVAMLAIMSSYDIYVMGIVADEMTDTEMIFRRKILIILLRSPFLRDNTTIGREVELSFIRHGIEGFSTMLYGKVAISREFAFNCFHDIVLGSALVCLQLAFVSWSNITLFDMVIDF